MPVSSRNSLKSWFERGDKPLATQFASWIDSFWHKDEDAIPQANIEGLIDLLNTLAPITAIANLRDELRDGVATEGDTLKKLYDLIVFLQSTKLDVSAYNQHFKGKFTTEAAMNAAYTPIQLVAGDYAQVNEVGSAQVRNFSWDTEDEVWVEGGSGGSGASDTDALPEGATNLYFTSARVLATVITGFVAGAGVVADTDTILQAINKIVGNVAERLPLAGGSMSGAINEAKWTDIASAATTDLGAANGNYGDVTGTTTITALGVIQAGTKRTVRFTGSLTLTHHAASLILPTGANIVTQAGDVAKFRSLGAGNWICTGYQRADGTSLTGGGGSFSGKTKLAYIQSTYLMTR